MTRAMRSFVSVSVSVSVSLRNPLARRRGPGLLLVVPTLLVACAGAVQPAHEARAPATSHARGSAPTPPPAAPFDATAAAPGSPQGTALLPRVAEITLDPRAPLRPLPELKIENIGLHVGGGPNDADTKAPFQHAVAERFPAFLDCYRKSEDPAQGGRFGIDLHIARAGGHPRVEQPRTAMHGPDFRACVSAVFESVQFAKPKHGPTTISYSLHFTVGEGS